MAWRADLSPCTYVFSEAGDRVKAVGWLEPQQPYPRGGVDAAVLARLEELRRAPWEPDHFMGYHACGFCNPLKREAASRREDTGVYNLFIPGPGFLYAAPELIVHYISKHGYAPPAEFQQAVLACPTMNSKEYRAAIRANGPADWRPKWMRDRGIAAPGLLPPE
jgi:hypothetical protein